MEAAIHLEDSDGVTVLGNDFEDFGGDGASSPGGGWIEVVEEEGDEPLRPRADGDEVEIRESDWDAIVGNNEIGGLQVEHGLIPMVTDYKVEGDFVDVGGERRCGGGRWRGRKGHGAGRGLAGRIENRKRKCERC